MTFNEFIDKIEHERAHCRDEFNKYKSVKDVSVGDSAKFYCEG